MHLHCPTNRNEADGYYRPFTRDLLLHSQERRMMVAMTRPITVTKPIVLVALTSVATVLFLFLSRPDPPAPEPTSMARSFVLWLHGLGDSGPANEPIKTLFTSPEFRLTKWSFPSAPANPVTCNCRSCRALLMCVLMGSQILVVREILSVMSIVIEWCWAIRCLQLERSNGLWDLPKCRWKVGFFFFYFGVVWLNVCLFVRLKLYMGIMVIQSWSPFGPWGNLEFLTENKSFF